MSALHPFRRGRQCGHGRRHRQGGDRAHRGRLGAGADAARDAGADRARAASAKGDVLSVAQLAGIMGAKRTAELIPLCHPLPLSSVKVELACRSEPPAVEITATCRSVGPHRGRDGGAVRGQRRPRSRSTTCARRSIAACASPTSGCGTRPAASPALTRPTDARGRRGARAHRRPRSRRCRRNGCISRLPPAGCWREDLIAARDQPPGDTSAMDGYAVRAADLASGPRDAAPGRQRARGRLATTGELGPGETVRIFTGGLLPEAPTPWRSRRTPRAEGERVAHRGGGRARRLRASGRARFPARRARACLPAAA